MSLKKNLILLSYLLTTNLFAENSYVDDFHNSMSDSVFSLSKSIDKVLSNDYNDYNTSADIYDIEENADSMDSFFKTDKYIDETEETFFRVNFNTIFQSKGSNDFGYSNTAIFFT